MYNHDDHHVHNDEVSMMINMLRTQPTARHPHIQVRMATVPHMVPASPSAGISSGSHGSQVLIWSSHGSPMVLMWSHMKTLPSLSHVVPIMALPSH